MGKIKIENNYRVKIDGLETDFYAVSVRQAWYTAYELSSGEMIQALYQIDNQGNIVDCLMEEED